MVNYSKSHISDVQLWFFQKNIAQNSLYWLIYTKCVLLLDMTCDCFVKALGRYGIISGHHYRAIALGCGLATVRVLVGESIVACQLPRHANKHSGWKKMYKGINSGQWGLSPIILTDGAIIEYQFLVDDGGGWVALGEYSTSSSFQWTPTVADTYLVKVDAREKGTTEIYSDDENYEVTP